MSVSLPSKEIYAVDIPEVNGFKGTFQYNFFTSDESVSETGGIPTRFLQRRSDDIDATFIQYAVTRAPRLIVFEFKLPYIGNVVSDGKQRDYVFSTNAQNGSLIADNYDRILSEDDFASNNYVAVNFHDGEIDDKIYEFVSGSYELHTLNKAGDKNVGNFKASYRLNGLTPGYIKPGFLFSSMGNYSKAYGTRYFDKQGKRIFNGYFHRLKGVALNAQVNSKLFNSITSRTIKDPNSPYTTDMQGLNRFAEKLSTQLNKRQTVDVSSADYKTIVPFVDINGDSSYHSDHYGAEIVGYVIDKMEHLRNGQLSNHGPIIIENPRSSITADFRIKYNSTYSYVIRTIALFTVPAIDDDTGKVAMIKLLVSSKPSNKVYVTTTEMVAPPPPTNLNFTWDYERVNPTTAQHDFNTGLPLPGTGRPGSLLVHWTFPSNPQRDIKKFQLFRRKSIQCPFELIKMYDFDDSAMRFPNSENPDQRLVEYVKSPCTFCFDDDFHVNAESYLLNGVNGSNDQHQGSTTYIYAVAAIDAHGLTSNFSAQYEVWFDQFKNRLEKRLVSHSGAPKPYPNLYLEADVFVDTIRTSGPNNKRLKVYFNPEHYYLYDDEGRFTRLLATKQMGGSYKLQFMNVDNQGCATLNIGIDDMMTAPVKFKQREFG